MAKPAKSILNVLVGYANLYIAPEGTEAPEDTVPFNEDWGAPWYHPGYTDKGVTLGFDRKEKRHMVEEISSPAVITVETSTLKISVGLAESTIENIKYAMGGGTITTTAAGVGTIGKKSLVLSDDLQVVTLGFEGKNPQGFFRRVIIPRVVATGKLKTEFDRSKNKQVFNAEFESVCPIEEVVIYEKTANATS